MSDLLLLVASPADRRADPADSPNQAVVWPWTSSGATAWAAGLHDEFDAGPAAPSGSDITRISSWLRTQTIGRDTVVVAEPRPTRYAASGQQPVRVQPGHGSPSRARATRGRRGGQPSAASRGRRPSRHAASQPGDDRPQPEHLRCLASSIASRLRGKSRGPSIPATRFLRIGPLLTADGWCFAEGPFFCFDSSVMVLL